MIKIRILTIVITGVLSFVGYYFGTDFNLEDKDLKSEMSSLIANHDEEIKLLNSQHALEVDEFKLVIVDKDIQIHSIMDSARRKEREGIILAQAEFEKTKERHELQIRQLKNILDKKDNLYQKIIEKASTYVPEIQKTDSVCNLSNGSVGLLNYAAIGELPAAPTRLDRKNYLSSDVKEAELINYTHLIIDKYNAVKIQCNALIDWTKNENKQ